MSTDGRPSNATPANTEADRIARVGISRCVEAEDLAAATALTLFGAPRLWELINGSAPAPSEAEDFGCVQQAAGVRGKGLALVNGLRRWSARAHGTDPVRDLHNAELVGGGVVIPGDPHWPVGLDDLGWQAPYALWWRGTEPPPAQAVASSLAVVGTRDPSPYGLHVTGQLFTEVAAAGVTIVSGGALGIDARAHHAALDAGEGEPRTICVLASGIDRLYPGANERLLNDLARHELIVTESPPGSAPMRWRFLARNRLIAALAAGTVVVEGRWRSGSLSTAERALELGRWVGAVPGPINAATSEGPHRLLADDAKPVRIVTCAQDVVAQMPRGAHGAQRWDQPAFPGLNPGLEPGGLHAEGPGITGPSRTAGAGASNDRRITDGMDPVQLRVWEAIPLRGAAGMDRILVVAGLSPTEALPALSRLSRAGLVRQVDGAWRRTARTG